MKKILVILLFLSLVNMSANDNNSTKINSSDKFDKDDINKDGVLTLPEIKISLQKK